MRLLCLGSVVASALLAGCVGNSGDTTPAAPSPTPVPTANNITIAGGVDALRTGFIADYTVVASMSDGTTQTVTREAQLTTSDSSIATVDVNGRITALSHGSLVLAASYQGRTAARKVNIVYNYGGSWAGTFSVRGCDQTGVFATARYCQNLGAGGAQSFSLLLAQSGNNVDRIDGSISIGNLPGEISGNVTSDGRLVIGGSYVAATGGASFRVEIGGWDTRASGANMTGRWAHNLTVLGSVGNAYVSTEIVTAMHKLEDRGVAADY